MTTLDLDFNKRLEEVQKNAHKNETTGELLGELCGVALKMISKLEDSHNELIKEHNQLKKEFEELKESKSPSLKYKG